MKQLVYPLQCTTDHKQSDQVCDQQSCDASVLCDTKEGQGHTHTTHPPTPLLYEAAHVPIVRVQQTTEPSDPVCDRQGCAASVPVSVRHQGRTGSHAHNPFPPLPPPPSCMKQLVYPLSMYNRPQSCLTQCVTSRAVLCLSLSLCDTMEGQGDHCQRSLSMEVSVAYPWLLWHQQPRRRTGWLLPHKLTPSPPPPHPILYEAVSMSSVQQTTELSDPVCDQQSCAVFVAVSVRHYGRTGWHIQIHTTTHTAHPPSPSCMEQLVYPLSSVQQTTELSDPVCDQQSCAASVPVCVQRQGGKGSHKIIIIIIIAFKGTIRDFVQSPHSAANCLQHVRPSGLGATVCKSRATHRARIMCKCHVMCHLVRRDRSAIKFDRVETHLFELYFIGWTIKPMKEGRKLEYPEKTPGDELQKMPHTTARRFKPQARLEPTQ